MLKEGINAVDFTLPDEDGNDVTLSSFLGKKVVLYFYPKDATPGCTKQACAFKDTYAEFKRQDIVIIGISKDTSASHKKFKEKYELPFILLSDSERNVIQAYDVWKEKKLYGKSFMGILRVTYLINEQGLIEKVFEKASPANNANDILSYLNEV